MNDRRASSSKASRRRYSWALFGVVSVIALGACLSAALNTGNQANVAVALVGGLIVVGIAAMLMGSFLSPLPDHNARKPGPYASGGLGGVGAAGFGGLDGGAAGGGDCGGGGG